MKVLIACEYSGVVRDAFAAKGHDAWSCDLIESETPGQHLIMDNDLHLKDTLYKKKWDMVIAHPPCTRLCNSGVCRLYINSKKEFGIDMFKWAEMIRGAEFFKMILNSPVKRLCIENPIPHKYAMNEIKVKYSQIIQPYTFGENATKATCLWLRNLPLLESTRYFRPDITSGSKRWSNQSPSGRTKLGGGKGKEKARTYNGISDAMASQWSNLLF